MIPSTTPGHVPTLPSLHPVQPPQSRQAVQPLQFNGRRDRFTRSKIDDDVYRLLLKAPKSELHVHQGGSSGIEVLSHKLRDAIHQGKIDTLPLYHEDGTYSDIYFTDPGTGKLLPPEQLLYAMEMALTLPNLREYYRYQLEMDNQRAYLPSTLFAEATATPVSRFMNDEMVSATEPGKLTVQKAQGLQAYRQTSQKINPFVKNNPATDYLLANEYAKSLALENVRYTEYRVSPSGNGIGGSIGSNVETMLSSVYSGFRDAQQYLNQRNTPLNFGLLVLFERQGRLGEANPNARIERAIALARQVVGLKKQGKYNIVGVDLAGDEAHNPVTDFEPAFRIIKEYNATAKPENRLGITIHAGETTYSDKLQGFESIAKAIEVASDANTPVRIGHGLQLVNSSPALRQAFQMYLDHPTDWERRINKQALLSASPLLGKVIRNQVVLEMCPKSNLQTYGIHPGFPGDQFQVRRSQYSAEAYKRHPAVFLSRLGVKVAISSDNRTISNTDATNEYVKLFKYAGLTYNDFKTMVLNGFEGAFVADPKVKKAILADVANEFDKLEANPRRFPAIEKMHGSLNAYQKLLSTANRIRAKL